MTGMKCCCIFFARGYCPYGWECEYLHTLPDVSMTLPKTLKDCFARDKFADYRDDMGGVGSCMNHAWLGYVRVVEAPVCVAQGPESSEREICRWEIESAGGVGGRRTLPLTLALSKIGYVQYDALTRRSVDRR
ncbi:hypothetical protein BDQ17DRAFT_1339648 [Cyathus striatus]|nr:hypothetical protein BDQ17DRAFT_1339648 [Cyathus striatus]